MKTPPHRHHLPASARYTCPVVEIPQGGGDVLLRPGRPQERLTVAELAAKLGVSVYTIYRYISEGYIPDQYVSYCGKRRILVAAAALDHVLEKSRRLRGG